GRECDACPHEMFSEGHDGGDYIDGGTPTARWFSPTTHLETQVVSGRRDEVRVSALIQPSFLQQRPRHGIAASEVTIDLRKVCLPGARQHSRAEAVAVLARQAAVLDEPVIRVGIEHLGPEIRVVPG